MAVRNLAREGVPLPVAVAAASEAVVFIVATTGSTVYVSRSSTGGATFAAPFVLTGATRHYRIHPDSRLHTIHVLAYTNRELATLSRSAEESPELRPSDPAEPR